MNLDKILAVGGAAHGSRGLLVFGLAGAIPLPRLGSGVVARAPHVVLVLTHAMILIPHDDLVQHVFQPNECPKGATWSLRMTLKGFMEIC